MAGVPEGLFGAYAGMGTTILYVVVLAVIVGLIGLAFYFFVYRGKAYDTRVIILSERSGDVNKIYYDRARFIKNKDTGASEIRLKNSKTSVPTIDYDSLIVNKQGKSTLFFREKADNVLYPIGKFTFPNDAEIEMSAIPNDLALVAAAEKKYARSLYDKPKMWEKILPIMTIGVTGVFVIILVWFVLRDVKTIATAIQGVTQVCQAASNAV